MQGSSGDTSRLQISLLFIQKIISRRLSAARTARWFLNLRTGLISDGFHAKVTQIETRCRNKTLRNLCEGLTLRSLREKNGFCNSTCRTATDRILSHTDLQWLP